jgi:hypothetical protein
MSRGYRLRRKVLRWRGLSLPAPKTPEYPDIRGEFARTTTGTAQSPAFCETAFRVDEGPQVVAQ